MGDIFVDGAVNFEKLYVPCPSGYSGHPSRYLYPVVKHSAQLVLCSPFKGALTKGVKQAIADLQLSSVVEVVSRYGKGDRVMQSSDLQTSPGTVLMVNESEQQLLEDIRRLREAEADKNGIYIVADNVD